jgi:hypothetical protein
VIVGKEGSSGSSSVAHCVKQYAGVHCNDFFSNLCFALQMFKSKFSGWDEVIAVDFTRTAESVQRTGADLTKWARQQETKVC